MKRLITFICLFIIIFVGYYFINNGFEGSIINIASYDKIESKSEALTKKLASYDKKNQEEYETAVTNLNSSIKTYKDSKAKYETIVEELADYLNKDEDEVNETIEEIIYSDKEKYKVDFLLVTLGDYGEKEGVDVVYQLTTSSTTDPNSSTLNYFLADLKFTVTGQYMDVANFISDLENDEKLKWEISGFAMGNGGSGGVSAMFTIKDVPIDSESYLESKVAQDGNAQGQSSDSTQNPANASDPNNPNATADSTNSNTMSDSENMSSTNSDSTMMNNDVGMTNQKTMNNTNNNNDNSKIDNSVNMGTTSSDYSNSRMNSQTSYSDGSNGATNSQTQVSR